MNYSWKKLMEDYSYAIEIYPDVIPTLERLKNNYNFIIISNARKEFIEIQIEKLDIERYFKRVFSTVSDFNMVKKEGEVYRKVCEEMGIDKSEIIHVGDDYKFDFLAPRSIGIKAIYLDRKGGKNGDFVISSLEYLPDLINRF
ncbi:MAG TPA: HAD family hydrolase [Thermoplasmatales archaeon]|nr:HAD family hydrolase [Thermoplasmatales archaeon]